MHLCKKLETSSPLKPVVRIENYLAEMVKSLALTKIAKGNLICQKIWSQGGVAYQDNKGFKNLL